MPGKSLYFLLRSAVNLKLISDSFFKREINVLKCVNIFLILRRLVTKRLNVLAGILGCELGFCVCVVCVF